MIAKIVLGVLSAMFVFWLGYIVGNRSAEADSQAFFAALVRIAELQDAAEGEGEK